MSFQNYDERVEIIEDKNTENIRPCHVNDFFSSLVTFVPVRVIRSIRKGKEIIEKEYVTSKPAFIYVENGEKDTKYKIVEKDSKLSLIYEDTVFTVTNSFCDIKTRPSSKSMVNPTFLLMNSTRTLARECFDYLNKKVDIREEGMSEFLSLWTMGTFFYDCFPSYPYQWINGEMSVGKTTLLETEAYLSYYGNFITDLSPANVYRIVDSTGASLFIDEGEKLWVPDKDKSGDAQRIVCLLNTGYKQGASVPRFDPDTGITYNYNTYSPKAFASVNKIEATLASRSIMLVIRKKKASNTMKPMVHEMESYRDKMYQLRLFHAPRIKREYLSWFSNPNLLKDLNMNGVDQRFGELVLPIVFCCVKFYPDWLPLIRKFIYNQLELRKSLKSDTVEVSVMNIVGNMVLEEQIRKKPNFWFYVSDITQKLKDTTDYRLSPKAVSEVLQRLGFTKHKIVGGTAKREIDPKRVREYFDSHRIEGQ